MRITFPFEPVIKMKERVSECTKVSLRSVKRILKQRKDSAERNNGISILNSPPKRHRKCTVTNLEEYELGDFQNFVYKFHITEKCRVTMEHLNQKLKNDYGWKGSTSSLRRVLKKIRFKWAKTPDNKNSGRI
jgi:transposase